MRKELDDLLCERYPLIFAERHSSMKETAMYWGFECGDGWFDLIDTLCGLLQHETDNNKAPQVVAVQVKEKFGSLRFYTRGKQSKEQSGMIDMAEQMSVKLCDRCGKPGKTVVKDSFLYMTRCPDHAPDNKHNAEN